MQPVHSQSGKGKKSNERRNFIQYTPKFPKINDALHWQSHEKTDTSYTLGVKNGTCPVEKGTEIPSWTTYVFTLGPSHPMSRNLPAKKKYCLYDVTHDCMILLRAEHQHFQPGYNIPNSSVNAEAYSTVLHKMIQNYHCRLFVPLNGGNIKHSRSSKY